MFFTEHTTPSSSHRIHVPFTCRRIFTPIDYKLGHKTNLNKDKVQNHKDYIFSDHKKVKLKIKGRERLKNEQICGY